jgi:tetratricopeptide (TPR) repeat protein
LVGDWVNRAILEPGTEGFVLSGQGEPDIPNDVHTIWVQRLERVLDESAERAVQSSTAVVQRIAMQVALEIAVALGGRVEMGEWMAVCALAGVPDPSAVLESLLASRMAYGDAGTWSFTHSMFRDAIERISREKRRWPSHNRLCADMLEERRPVPHWGDSERIGRHRFEATQFAASIRALLRGSRERRRLEEYSAALWLLTLYDRALDELGRPDDDIQRLEGWLVQADINCMRRDLKEAEEVASRVRTFAVSLDAQRVSALALLVLARVHHLQGNGQTGLSEFSDAQHTLRMTGPKQDLAKCLSEWAGALLEVGQMDPAWRAFNEAQQIYEDIGQLIPWAENHLGLARVALRQGDTVRSEVLCNRVRNFARREQLNRLEAEAWVVFAETLADSGRLGEAIAALDKSIELFEQLGLSRQAFHPRSLRVLLWAESGQVERAKTELTLLQTSPNASDPRMSGLLMRSVGLALAVDGSAAEFQSKLSDVADRMRDAKQLPVEVTRSFRLAAERAAQTGFADRALQVNSLFDDATV